MSLTWWWYPTRRFAVDDRRYALHTKVKTDGLFSRLVRDGAVVAEDHTPTMGPDATRNHRLADILADGRRLEVEAGYIGFGWVTGIVARIDDRIVHESHPGRRIAYPNSLKGMAEAENVGALAPRNRVPIAVDIATGLLFFIVAKLTDLTTAALVGAAVGIGLVVFQRITRIDVTGGLALFGIVMALISAGIAVVAQDEIWVQLRSTIVGLIVAALFLGDALVFEGRKFAAALARYLPFEDIDFRRLGIGLSLSGATMALLNVVVVRLASRDVWLFYATFLDIGIALLLFWLVLRAARRPSRDRRA